MGIFARKQGAFLKWLVVISVTILAILSVSLRIFLPNLDEAKAPLQHWANNVSGFNLDFTSVSGHWDLFVPSLSLHSFSLSTPDREKKLLTAKSIDIQFDLWASLQQMKPMFSNVTIHGLHLDLTQFPKRPNREEITLKKQLERLFIVGLGRFSIEDSTLIVLSAANKRETIQINSLLWDSRSGKHQLEGIFSVQGTSLNHVEIKGVFTEKTGLQSLDGNFYLDLENVSLKNWITTFVNPNIAISQAKVGGEIWFSVEKGRLQSAQLRLKKSQFIWSESVSKDKEKHFLQTLSVLGGRVHLNRLGTSENWTLMTDQLQIKTGRHLWSDPGIEILFTENDWLLNVEQLDLFLLMPLRSLFNLPQNIDKALVSLFPRGQARDIRFAQTKDVLSYSARLKDVSFKHWGYLPQVHNLSLFLAGKGKQGEVLLELENDTLPYGPFFQAPLKIDEGKVAINWQLNDEGAIIWSESVAVRTPDLNLLGEFRLDIPHEGSPWLSFYAQANLKNASKTWRYLPTLALGETLTDYLSSAIFGGGVQNAKLLWNGDFATFPYLENEGIFQAFVPVKNGKFNFDTLWPMLTGLDVDLLFQNDALYFDASHADLMGTRGFDIKGAIPSFSAKDVSLSLQASIEGSGDEFRDYMLATPLVDSVGAALTHVQVAGDIKGKIKLNVPFSSEDPHVEGSVTLKKNTVSLLRPEIVLKEVTGRIDFENDIIWAKGLRAHLLEQPVDFAFQGETESEDYLVDIQMSADWQANKLKAALDVPDIALIDGSVHWDLILGVALKDTGFTYDVDLKSDLTHLNIDVPPPLKKPYLVKAQGHLKASGDAQRLVAQLELPNLKYQADIDIQGDRPEVTRSRTVIGEGSLSLHPLLGNVISITQPEIDLLAWKNIWDNYRLANQDGPPLPFKLNLPSRLNVKADKLLAGEIVFNDFSLSARNKSGTFRIIVGSRELAGYAWWERDKLLTVSIEHLFLNLDKAKKKAIDKTKKPKEKGIATKEDLNFMAALPTTRLLINELWFQGYRLGKLEANVLKSKNKLTLSHFLLSSGDTKLKGKGAWGIYNKGINKTEIDFQIEGANSSDLMGRFAVSDGIQDARFMTKGKLNYTGPPWSMKIDTLNAEVETRLEKGYVSGVGGVGKLLGLFSLESILRKIQFDFSGVFDDGLPFNKINGTASIKKGVVVTDNIEMKALAGDMYIKGTVDLVKNQVNANVRFIPDLTSGIPVFTAFAVTPQTALYVLAVTTVISPVIDAFTQVKYQVTGSIDNPVIHEVSRKTSEVTLPEKATQRLRSEQQGRKWR